MNPERAQEIREHVWDLLAEIDQLRTEVEYLRAAFDEAVSPDQTSDSAGGDLT